MFEKIGPQLGLTSQMSSSIADTGMNFNKVSKINKSDESQDFKSVMSGMVSNLNDTLAKPDNLLSDVVSGNGNADVHDVMIAMSKAEISLSVATNTVSKVIQAYDKITQIQV